MPGLAEKRPSLLKGDRLYVSKNHSDKEFEGYVHQVCQEGVYLKFSGRSGRSRIVPCDDRLEASRLLDFTEKFTWKG